MAHERRTGHPWGRQRKMAQCTVKLLAQSIGARRILEIGTLGGYSTIWLARAVTPGGRVVTLELNSAFAELARSNLARAGLAEVLA